MSSTAAARRDTGPLASIKLWDQTVASLSLIWSGFQACASSSWAAAAQTCPRFVAEGGGDLILVIDGPEVAGGYQPIEAHLLDPPMVTHAAPHQRVSKHLSTRRRRAEWGESLEHDAALLVVVRDSRDHQMASVLVPPQASAVGEARRWVHGQLKLWGLDEEVQTAAVLGVSELVTNVVLHAGEADVMGPSRRLRGSTV